MIQLGLDMNLRVLHRDYHSPSRTRDAAYKAMMDLMIDELPFQIDADDRTTEFIETLRRKIYGRIPMDGTEKYRLGKSDAISTLGSIVYWFIVEADDFCVWPDRKGYGLFKELRARYGLEPDLSEAWRGEILEGYYDYDHDLGDIAAATASKKGSRK